MKIFNYIYILTMTLLCVSCSKEDDLNELFIGKKWLMTGATINGNVMNSEVKNLYQSGTSAYFINFATSSFNGTLSEGTNISGNWSADGEKKSMTLSITQTSGNISVFDKNLYTILKNIKKYEGDSNIMILKQDDDNYIRFSANR